MGKGRIGPLLLCLLLIDSCAFRKKDAEDSEVYDNTQPPFMQDDYTTKLPPPPEEEELTRPAPSISLDIPEAIESFQALYRVKKWKEAQEIAAKITAADPSNDFGYLAWASATFALKGVSVQSNTFTTASIPSAGNQEFNFYALVAAMPFVDSDELMKFRQANREFAEPDDAVAQEQKKIALTGRSASSTTDSAIALAFAQTQLAVAATVVKNSTFNPDGIFNYGVAAERLKDSDVRAVMHTLKEVNGEFKAMGEATIAASIATLLDFLAQLTAQTVAINADVYKYYGLKKETHTSKDDRSSFLQYLVDKSGIVVSVDKIWDAGKFNGFTDMVRFKGQFIVVFREGETHYSNDERGKVRVLTSPDGKKWNTAALIAESDKDLRDPKISVTPDNKLMLNVGGNIFTPTNEVIELSSHVAFSDDGKTWTPLRRLTGVGKEWLWQVTWHKGKAWGVSYGAHFSDSSQPSTKLYSSDNGIDYTLVTDLNSPFNNRDQNEASIRFLNDTDDTAVILLRFDGQLYIGAILTAKPPYKDWHWEKIPNHVGGPAFQILPNGKMWAVARSPISPHHDKLKTIVSQMTNNSYQYYVALPSDGDNGYPGIVWYDNHLYVSYYSSHEIENNLPKSRIYFAKIKLPK